MITSKCYKNQNYNKLKSECLQSGKLFCDEFFKFTVEGAEWLRPQEICKNPRFFVDDASRFDVIQGHMGDCWLVVAMASITMNKTLFKHVVPTDQSFVENYAGIFHFRIWQCGDWVDVVVDDRLPTKDRQLLFAHSKKKNEFWSALLEKAYSKLYGFYEQLKGGWFCESMVDFTGGMVETVNLKPPPSNLDKIIFNSVEKSSFMCVYIKRNTSITEEISENGLVNGHAYNITNALYVTPRSQSEKIFLVRLRNPWGKVEWNGAWSDSSPEWNALSEEDKHKVGLVCDTDGEFWMCLSDFTANFQYIDICHLGPNLFDNVDDEDESSNKARLGKRLPATETDSRVQRRRTWIEHDFRGEWIKDVNAGGNSVDTIHMNPQFIITLTQADVDSHDLCTVIIALMQKNITRNVWHRIGFTVLNIDDCNFKSGVLSQEYIQKKLQHATSSVFKHTREIVVRYEWAPGTYCILVSTRNPNQEGKFLLRVFSETASTTQNSEDIAVDNSESIIKPQTIPEQSSSDSMTKFTQGKRLEKLVYRNDQEVKAFFNRISEKDKGIGWQGLQSLLQFALSPDLGLFTRSSDSRDVKFPKYECHLLITMLDDDRSGRLEFEEFQHLWSKIRKWESIFLQCSGNSEYITAPLLKQALIIAGYQVPSSKLGEMVRQHADDAGRFTFNDFVMCAVQLQTS